MRAKYLKVLISSVALTTLVSAQEVQQPAEAPAVPVENTPAAPIESAPAAPETAPVAEPTADSVAVPAEVLPAVAPVADSMAAPVENATDSTAAVAPSAPADSSTAIAAADSTVQVATDALPADTAATDEAPAGPAADTVATETGAAATPVVSDSTETPVVSDSIAPAVVDSVVVPAPAEPQIVYTEISGSLKGFLNEDNSPYLATADLIIEEKDALVIGAGVEILFKPGVGLDIQGGAFAAMGQEDAPIILRAEGDSWKGVSLTGETRANFNNVQIQNAKTAIALENTGADIRNVKISKSGIGISVKKSSIDLQNSSIQESTGLGLYVGEGSTVSAGNTEISGGKAGYLAEQNSKNIFSNVSITKNDFGLVNLGNNTFDLTNLKVQENDIGIAATEVPSIAMAESSVNNRLNSDAGAADIARMLPTPPENTNAQKFKESETATAEIFPEEAPRRWNLTGNVSTQVGYHLVRTLHNTTGESYVLGSDTIQVGDRFNNVFQVPGLFSGYNTYLKLDTPFGQTMEFSAEIGSDHWNEWNVHRVNLTYTDALRQISLGDTYLNAGDIYLNGINLFGATYTVDHLKEPGERPVFETTVFAGETNRPKLVGEKNPDIYKDIVEDGEGEAQEMVAGGMVTWNMHRRFNGTVGFMASENYKEDPFFRDGMGSSRNTINPEISSRTFFAEGNWLFWPGNVELNGQIAFGAADTTDASAQRAINSVFSKAGVSASNFALLRRLMKKEELISGLSNAELDEIFGDNNRMTPSEKKTQLKNLLDQARTAKKKYDKSEDDQSSISEWDGNNIAVLASARWGFANTMFNAHYKFVGNKFYSAGSPDQLSNSRELGLSVDQRLMKFWKSKFSYDLSVENASIGSEPNVFGFSEGTTMGLLGDPSRSWERKHDQDDLRALFIHNLAFKNSFTLGNLELSLRYKMNYRTRHRATRLHADYDINSGIFSDDWFKPKKGAATYTIQGENDTLEIDSARYATYYGLARYDYLASGFEERLLKHTVEAEVGFKFNKNLLKVGGVWIYRTDRSHFDNDSLLKHVDFSNKTLGLLGYYFHGADFFEQRYPISFTTEYSKFRNQVAFLPRYKIYNRDNMKEFEWTLSENLELEVVKDFIDVNLNAEFRQEFIRRHSDGVNEDEADVNTATTVRIHHTKDLYSDYTFGNNYSYRPDSRSEQYSDYFVVFSLNYAF